jgi:hypothetical protein
MLNVDGCVSGTWVCDECQQDANGGKTIFTMRAKRARCTAGCSGGTPKGSASLSPQPWPWWMGHSSEVRQLSRSIVYARLAGTARCLVAFRCPHLLHFQPLMTRTRPSRSNSRGRRTQRAWVWRVCSLHRVQWMIRVSTSPIGGALYHGLMDWQCRVEAVCGTADASVGKSRHRAQAEAERCGQLPSR